jgi:hypothetical protein
VALPAGRPGHPPPQHVERAADRALTAERIVASGIAVATAVGPDAASIRRRAAEFRIVCPERSPLRLLLAAILDDRPGLRAEHVGDPFMG